MACQTVLFLEKKKKAHTEADGRQVRDSAASHE